MILFDGSGEWKPGIYVIGAHLCSYMSGDAEISYFVERSEREPKNYREEETVKATDAIIESMMRA